MAAGPICISCKIDRKFVESAHAATNYEIRTFECPECASVLRLVVKCEKTADRPALRLVQPA